jgi:hypothetical protein
LIQPEEFYDDPDIYAGRRIVVRGFLKPLSGDLVIYPSEAAAANAAHHENSIYVEDTSPRKVLRLEGTYVEITCTHHNVEVGGVVGVLPREFYGIVSIDYIKTFESGEISGPGELCYSSGDPEIYHPAELEEPQD